MFNQWLKHGQILWMLWSRNSIFRILRFIGGGVYGKNSKIYGKNVPISTLLLPLSYRNSFLSVLCAEFGPRIFFAQCQYKFAVRALCVVDTFSFSTRPQIDLKFSINHYSIIIILPMLPIRTRRSGDLADIVDQTFTIFQDFRFS